MEIDDSVGMSGENVKPLTDDVAKALSVAFERYYAYLDSFGPDELNPLNSSTASAARKRLANASWLALSSVLLDNARLVLLITVSGISAQFTAISSLKASLISPSLMSGKCVKPSLKQRVLPIPIAKGERLSICGEYKNQKAVILYEYETFKATKGEQLLDTYLQWKQYGTLMRQTKNLMDINIDALYNILKQNQGDVNDALGYKKKAVVVTSDPLALVAKKTKVSKRKEKVKVQTESEGSDGENINDLKKITALLAKAFNQKKYYAKPTNNSLRTSSASSSLNKKPEYVKSMEKKEDKKADEKKRDMSKVKCYNCKKEGHFSKYCKKAKVKYYNYYKTKMLLAKKDSDEQVLLAADQAWMESYHVLLRLIKFFHFSSHSYAHVVNSGSQTFHKNEEVPAIVLDDSCINVTQYDTALMGEVKDITSLSNLKKVLTVEGFESIKIKYMGGFWVMMEFDTEPAKEKFKTNVGIGTWFTQIIQATNDFSINERVVWIDIEGNRNVDKNSEDSLHYPPGFTPVILDAHNVSPSDREGEKYSFHGQEDKVDSDAKKTSSSPCSGHFQKCKLPRSGGSILQIMEELIKVGQTMGYNMEGCTKNIGDVIDHQGEFEGEKNQEKDKIRSKPDKNGKRGEAKKSQKQLQSIEK
nr:nucleotide-binding alpha-beta plait domain-containing protein [Tanacetum cinerariifolium]